LESGLPTYLDTLPSLSIYALTGEGYKLVDLITESECAGGYQYAQVIKDRFRLLEDKSRLDVFLQLGQDESTELRKLTFDFQYPPKREMPLDVDIRMKPASGLATVELKPEDPGFLEGRHVYLDWEHMEPAAELPKATLGYPPLLEEHVTDHRDAGLLSNDVRSLIEGFLKCSPLDREYGQKVTSIRKTFSQSLGATYNQSLGRLQNQRLVGVHGNVGTEKGAEIVTRVTAKLDEDFGQVVASGRCVSALGELIRAGMYFYLSAPTELKKYVLSELHGGQALSCERVVWEAAGRILSTGDQINVFLRGVTLRIRTLGRHRSTRPSGLHNYILYALQRIFQMREDAPFGLERSDVGFLFRKILEDISWCLRKRENPRILVVLIGICFYLFRYRSKETNFLAKGSGRDKDLRHDIEKGVSRAIEDLRKEKGSGRVQEHLKGIRKFLDHEGSLDLVRELEKDLNLARKKEN
jgi:hypothetical protein